MIESDALRVIAYYEATYRLTLAPTEQLVFSQVLGQTQYEDAIAAVNTLAAMGEFPPPAQRVADVAAACRYQRLELEAAHPPAITPGTGPSLAEFLDENPDKRELLEQIRNAPVLAADPPMTAAEREEVGQLQPPARLPVPMGLCTGTGRQLVWNERFGEHCCPSCGGPRSVGCWSEDSASYRAYMRLIEQRERQEATP